MIETLSIAVQNALPMQTMNLWTDFVNLLYNILSWIYSLVGNFGVAVILFTILVRLVLLPLDIKSKGSMKKMAEISPEVQKINEKYKNDPEKKNRKLQELYAKKKINPLGGCLPMLLQLPLFFAFFAALRSISYQEMIDFYVKLINHFAGQEVIAINVTGDMMKFFREFGLAMQNLFKNVDKFKDAFEAVIAKYPDNFNPDVMNLDVLYSTVRSITVPQALSFLRGNERFLAYQFLWIKNIWVPDSPLADVIGRSIPYASMFSNISAGYNNGFFLLAAITGASSYFQMKISQQQNAAAQQNKGMQMLFPLMGVFFVAIYTASFGVYWVTSNVVMITQQLIYNKVTMGNYLGKPASEGAR
jgi:YidC/Oxa1 family membrane protein insertase